MTQTVEIEEVQTGEVTFSNVFPIMPKGVAVNLANDKVYAAFQGMKEADGTRPFPFVAAIDSTTDQVIAIVNGIGLEPFGVAVANNKVYVAAFRDGLVSVIDSQTDQLIKNIGGFVNPTRLAADPDRNLIHVADHGDGQVRAIDTTSDTVVEQFAVSRPEASGPFDVTSSDGFAYTTLRDAPLSKRTFPFNPFFLAATRRPSQISAIPLVYNEQTGSPYAITARTEGANTYLYITYAREFRNAWPPHEWPPAGPGQPVNNPVNPTHLTVVEVPDGNPAAARRLDTDLHVGDFAEIGLTFNPNTNHLLGTYGGGFYEHAYPDRLACALIPKARADSGSVYVLDGTTPWNPHLIDKPTPTLRVGNSTAPMTGDFWWRNPFDIAVNTNNNKVYVTDRCWHDYDDQYDNLFPDHEIWHDGGGAVFVFNNGNSLQSQALNSMLSSVPPLAPSNMVVFGQVDLQGGEDNQSVTITVDDGDQSAGQVHVTAEANGHFRIDNVTSGTHISITANAPDYLPAVCTVPVLTDMEINLNSVTLLSGDITDDGQVDIFDLVVAANNFGRAGSDLLADLNNDGAVDIYDLNLVGTNYGHGVQTWRCLGE
jgi:YVTN family beta-propeller protein